jgi:hypothetical protein
MAYPYTILHTDLYTRISKFYSHRIHITNINLELSYYSRPIPTSCGWWPATGTSSVVRATSRVPYQHAASTTSTGHVRTWHAATKFTGSAPSTRDWYPASSRLHISYGLPPMVYTGMQTYKTSITSQQQIHKYIIAK